MHLLDYLVVALFFVLMIAIGAFTFRKIAGSRDYFVAGGQIPWWLGGISHHVSSHSGVVYVALAAVAYRHGFTLYVWWAFTVVLATFAGAFWFAPRWARLRAARNIESPTEYLATRYNVATQQLMAWSGVALKIFDIGAKWAAIGVLLHGFTGLPVATAICVSGAVSLCYITLGGLWADLYTDLVQFTVQLIASVVLLVAVMRHLGGISSLWTVWDRLPPGHSDLFNGPYTPWFAFALLAMVTFSYNGGTWNLAVRYMGAQSALSARRSAMLSSALYATYPLILFFPMWAAPVILPKLADPNLAYVELTRQFLPTGMVGLVVAAVFAATMAMTTSDTNTISSVVTRDILPVLSRRFRGMDQRRSLKIARYSTLLFTFLTLLMGIEAERFGGVLGLMISWFAALVGPVSVPMLFGLLPVFRNADARAAIGSTIAGIGVFAIYASLFDASPAMRVLLPTATSVTVFTAAAWLNRNRPVPAEVEALLRAVSEDEPVRTAAAVPSLAREV